MTVHILQGDALAVLDTLPSQSVHCVVTSPPYWGLRNYGVDGQLGMEKTPEEYIAKMVEVFAQVSRVLRHDGTLWLNIGDCYSPSGGPGVQGTYGATADRIACQNGVRERRHEKDSGCKRKDLVGIPWMLAFALRADGWYLRSEIIWHKPNPMPESVTDRPTKSHEQIFLLTKSPKYFYDIDACREPITSTGGASFGPQTKQHTPTADGGHARTPTGDLVQSRKLADASGRNHPLGKNQRSVWTIPTHPFPDAHFATFPPRLAERCIQLGTSGMGCCPDCGENWERLTETSYANPGNRTTNGPRSVARKHATAGFAVRLEKRTATTGWHPVCRCVPLDPVPCTVLDPFGGAGTTGLVADRLGRDAILIELNAEYAEMARRRIVEDAGMFASVH